VTLALVLGAGGTHAAFEVGAVRWLTDHGYEYSIICGTSGGALNASRLAEGEIAGSDPAIARLERDWLALRNDADMWQPKPWLSRLGMDQQKLLRDSSLWDNIPWVFLGVKLLAGFVGAVDCKDFVNTLKAGLGDDSLFSMDPIRARLQATPASGGLNVSAIANSVIRMRLATVGLDSGRLRWIDNAGNLLDAAGQPVAGAASIPLTEGVLASAAIPVVFDPVTLNGERFTDGGVRQFVPIQAAVDTGADQVFAVVASKPGPPSVATGTFAGKGLLDIAARAADLMADEVQQKELAPAQWAGAQLTTIRPTIDLPDSLTVDPGWITILMAYGYMRAFDAVRGEVGNFASADEIVKGRLDIWDRENSAGQAVPMRGLLKWPTKAELTNLRAAKRALARSVAARIHGGGDVSAEIRRCWLQWERHTWNPSLFPDMWSDLHFQDGTSLQRESPPQLGAAVGIRPSGTLSPGVLTPFEVVAEDALLPGTKIGGTFVVDGNPAVSGNTNAGYTFQFEPGIHHVVLQLPNYGPQPAHSFLVRNYPAPGVEIQIATPPPPLKLNTPTTFTVVAKDRHGLPITRGFVTIDNPGRQAQDVYPETFPFAPGVTVKDFIFRAKTVRRRNPATGEVTIDTLVPTGVVQIPGFDDVHLDLGFSLDGPM